MSVRVDYDPALFAVQRNATVSARADEFLVGVSKLDTAGTDTWIDVPMASFSYRQSYTPNETRTLIVDAESASVSLSYWHQPTIAPLFAADRVRAVYNGETIFLGTVDSTRYTFTVDPAAAAHGATYRVDFSASLVGTYAAMLAKTVCWAGLPAEPAIDRIRRWITVTGW